MGIFSCDYLVQEGSIFTRYICKASTQEIPSSTATSVCLSSGRYNCEFYKRASHWYITTAVMDALGKKPCCRELKIFEKWRKDWLFEAECGQEFLEEYYEFAPKIVEAIDRLEDSQKKYMTINEAYITPCINAIKANNNQKAFDIYKKMFIDLKFIYLEK